ncbi:MAG: heme ABC transporter ATP-binding protein [Acidimicrobiaceae bacterium]|nr:heme ABC transporter ATP-binding protein [Acidimicrobiaceae bacterium]
MTMGTETRAAEAVRVSGASKRFGRVTAFADVDLVVRRGEIHALLGENGAGKTTLVKMLAGLETADSGEFWIDGEPIGDLDARSARDRGVALVQQHFTLVPTLTASENLVLARRESAVLPSTKVARARLTELVDRFGLDVRDGVPVSALSVGEQQRLEILRALDADAGVLLLDEPTAVLTGAEATALLGVCRRLADEGRAVVIITHRLSEVIDGCDRVTVLRDGSVVLADATVAEHSAAGLADAMVGREMGDARHREPTTTADGDARPARLRVDGVSSGVLRGVSFGVAAGEVLGVAGVDGNGQAELEAVLAAIVVPESGRVTLDGEELPHGRPRERIGRRVAYIPSDRYATALVRPMSLADNVELGRGGWWRPRRQVRQRAVEDRLARWDVRSAGAAAAVRSLSGGNAQKLVLARELDEVPDLVITCHPTRGLDPGAARTVAERVLDAADDGAAVVWMGAELEEVLAVSHRVIVLSRGRITGTFERPFDRSAIGLAMGGASRSTPPATPDDDSHGNSGSGS